MAVKPCQKGGRCSPSDNAIATSEITHMTQKKGIELRNWTSDSSSADCEVEARREHSNANLKGGPLFILFEIIGAEDLETALRFLSSETLFVALNRGRDILDNDVYVDFFLVIEIICIELDLSFGNEKWWLEKKVGDKWYR